MFEKLKKDVLEALERRPQLGLYLWVNNDKWKGYGEEDLMVWGKI